MATGCAGRPTARASLPIDMALADEAAFPHQGTLDFLDNQLDPSTGTIRAARSSATPIIA